MNPQDNSQVINNDNNKENIIKEEQSAAPVETQEQINWKKYREQREIERKEKDAAQKRANEKEAEAAALKAAMDALLNKPSPQQGGYQNEEDLSEDEKIQRKVDAALAARDRSYEEQRRQKEMAEFPQRLNSTYSDFNQVCTTENLDYLEYHYPEIASAFKHMPDGYEKWSSVYKAVKRFVNPDSKKDQSRAEKNMSKPQSMASPGVTQTSDSAPKMLDDKKRSDNWQRMQRVMKGLN